ncbi:alpha-1-antitrypsin homolog isoform X2 [Trichomycterus rosablanca]
MWERILCCLAFAFLLVASSAASTEDHGGEHHSADHHLHPALNESHDVANRSYQRLARINADFAFALYKKLISQADAKGKNIFFSPLSISMALSMLAQGAKDETQSEIFSTLGYGSLTVDQVNEAYEQLLDVLGHSQDAMLLETGGALAVREGFKVVEKFLKDVQHFYHGEAFSVDFSKPEVAAQEVNKYIAKKTNDVITDMVKSLDPDTVMVLINYIYFRGKWRKPFDVKHTRKASFYVDAKTKVTVDMMTKTSRYEFYQDQNNFTSVIMVPYKGNMSMMIVLPDAGKMDEVEKNIDMESLMYWYKKLSKKRSVKISMPKFSISASSSLKKILTEMGINGAFSDGADFSGISEEIKLKASKVLHQAVLKVDEKGTEAAGTTTLEMIPMSLPHTMNLNRPFLVFIVEETNPIVLFMGKITDPTA